MFDLLQLPFDQYQRYKLVQEIAETLRQEIISIEQNGAPLTVLDVGGYFLSISGQEFLPIRAFLPHARAYALDLTTSGYLEGYVQGSGLYLPFAEQTFDLVVSCDTLEHIPAKFREQFLAELLRISKYAVVLAAPFFAPNIATAEAIVLEFSQVKCGLDHPPLQEHRLYGLPSLEEVKAYLKRSGLKFETFPTGYLSDWLILMIAKQYTLILPNGVELSELIDRYYNLTYFNGGQFGVPNYRTVLVIAKNHSTQWLERITEVFQSRRTTSRPEEDTNKLLGIFQLLEKLSSDQERKVQKLKAQLQCEHERLIAVARPLRRNLWRYLEAYTKRQIKRWLNKEYRVVFAGQEAIPSTLLTHEIEFRQSFVASAKHLSGISFALVTYGRVNTSTMSLKLYDQSSEIVASTTTNMVELEDFSWFNFNFTSQTNSKNRHYTLVISAPDGVISDTISLLITLEGEQADHELWQNDRLVKGHLIHRLKYD